MLGLSFPSSEARDVSVRDMIALDVSQVKRVENASFEDPWSTQRIKECVSPPSGVRIGAIVAIEHSQIHGWLAYTWEKRHIDICTFAVHPLMRRQHLGSELLKHTMKILENDKLHWQRIICCVHEKWLPAQQLLRSMRFVCLGTRRGFFLDGDAFDFEYRLEN